MSAVQGWRWELGDEFNLLVGSWVRKVRVVRVTDTGPNTREYTLRELDDGNEILQSQADEEELDADRVVGAQDERGQFDAQGRHEDRQQVGGCDGATRRFEEHGPDLEGSGGEVGRSEADGEGFDGPVCEGRVREEQAGLEQGTGFACAEGPVLGCCTPWARVEPVCEQCPIWGALAGGLCGGSVGVADAGGVAVGVVESCGGGGGDLAGPARVYSSPGGCGVRDVWPVPPASPVVVSGSAVRPDLFRLQDEGSRPRIAGHPVGEAAAGCQCILCRLGAR